MRQSNRLVEAFRRVQVAVIRRQLVLLGREDEAPLFLWPIRLDEELERFEHWSVHELADQSPDPYRHAGALRAAVRRVCALPAGSQHIEDATARLEKYSAGIFFELLADQDAEDASDYEDRGHDDYEHVPGWMPG